GEQMHQAFGILYLKTMSDIYKEKNQRTYMDYRASGMFASSLPGTLYSDTYNHKEYIHMICNSAFGGLLWSPELRESANKDEFVHRFHTVLLSAQAVVNSWYLQNPPWLQYDRDKNNKNLFLDDAKDMESIVRSLVNTRMSLIPYLYTAFANYHFSGTPPFRPLIMDYPNDKRVRSICDQYMMGDNLMAAPLYETGSSRKVYFPEGSWYNFNTGQRYDGGKEYTIETKSAEMPLYVKSGTILPLAEPVQSVSAATVFNITCKVYGENAADFTLFEDDGTSFDYEKGVSNEVKLSTNGKKAKMQRSGGFKQMRYVVKGWEYIR
ncbi:MAG: glycoside hydrolase family 31 protein, partial [Bacteroidales bacterium]|nr:glycoside hydrolase family 31 protein [Bacteroidales bacterium]